MTKPTGRPRGRPKGSRSKETTGKALSLAKMEDNKERGRGRAVAPEFKALEVMRRCLSMALADLPEVVKAAKDTAAEAKDGKTILEAARVFASNLDRCFGYSKDIAPYESRRLAGERPLDQDAQVGPPVLVLTAADKAL